MDGIDIGGTFTVDGDEHTIVGVTAGHVITEYAYNDHTGPVERVWRASDLAARLGLLPLIPDGGIQLLEHAQGSDPGWIVAGSQSGPLFGFYYTGRKITVHPDGTWTENPRSDAGGG